MTTVDYTKQQLIDIVAESRTQAHKAAVNHIAKHGEDWYCGFAWINILGVKGNTKLGKMLKEAGVKQDYTKTFQIWNPSGHGTQSMLVKEAGAEAAAQVFRKYGFNASTGSRAD